MRERKSALNTLSQARSQMLLPIIHSIAHVLFLLSLLGRQFPRHKHVLLSRLKVSLAEFRLLQCPHKHQHFSSRSNDFEYILDGLQSSVWTGKVVNDSNGNGEILIFPSMSTRSSNVYWRNLQMNCLCTVDSGHLPPCLQIRDRGQF